MTFIITPARRCGKTRKQIYARMISSGSPATTQPGISNPRAFESGAWMMYREALADFHTDPVQANAVRVEAAYRKFLDAFLTPAAPDRNDGLCRDLRASLAALTRDNATRKDAQ